jgi:hypothetical protein
LDVPGAIKAISPDLSRNISFFKRHYPASDAHRQTKTRLTVTLHPRPKTVAVDAKINSSRTSNTRLKSTTSIISRQSDIRTNSRVPILLYSENKIFITPYIIVTYIS